jgi:two-component system, NtrC family, sensor kinase
MSEPMENATSSNRRILLVDDNPAIHEDFRKILTARATSGTEVDAEAAALFGSGGARESQTFELDSAFQGEEALEMVRRARDSGRPYAMAFVDMRMPPGWDGVTTISRIWELDHEIYTVICTAYSDRSWEQIQSTLQARERWLVMKKPFDKIEALQVAHALTEKWMFARMAALKVEALERMVEARTQDVVSLHRVKNDFLANVSHELLTPMNGMCGFLGLLADTALDTEQRGYVTEATQSSQRLLRLLRQVLDFNRSEARTLPVEPLEFTPRELLQRIALEHAAAAAAKGLRLHVEETPAGAARWVGPADVIVKTLGTLIDNAIKFTPQGSVTLRAEARSPGLELSVRDTGIGLTPQQLEWIRIPFAQVDGGCTRRFSGIGLGLPLAASLVQAMGGELSVSGKPDQGVVASFTVRAEPVPGTPARDGSARALSSPRP